MIVYYYRVIPTPDAKEFIIPLKKNNWRLQPCSYKKDEPEEKATNKEEEEAALGNKF